MANTMHGPFVKGATTTTGHYGTGGGQVNTYSSGNANNGETQSATALASFNPDLLTAFVLSGVTSAKDGTTASQLDVASGAAYLTVSDGTLARCDVASTTFSTTGNPSTTLYLFLKNDGTWQWGTTSTGPANSLAICQVTTDASSNIATVTDKRPTQPMLFGGMSGSSVALPAALELRGTPAPTTYPQIGHYPTGQAFQFWTRQSGGAEWHEFVTWNGSGTKVPFGVGSVGSTFFSNNICLIGDNGQIAILGGQASVGSFGAPVIVAQAENVAVTSIAQATLITFTPPATGIYRANLYASSSGANPSTISAWVGYTSPTTGVTTKNFVVEAHGTIEQLNSVSIATPVELAAFSMTVRAAAGGAISICYRNTTATPNDTVSAFLERLS